MEDAKHLTLEICLEGYTKEEIALAKAMIDSALSKCQKQFMKLVRIKSKKEKN